MQPLGSLTQENDSWKICDAKDLWIELNEGILSVKGESALALVKWSESDDLTAINASSVVVVSPEIGMRDAIKLKQISNHPILLVEDDLLVGILDNSEFYSALTGNFQLNNAA